MVSLIALENPNVDQSPFDSSAWQPYQLSQHRRGRLSLRLLEEPSDVQLDESLELLAAGWVWSAGLFESPPMAEQVTFLYHHPGRLLTDLVSPFAFYLEPRGWEIDDRVFDLAIWTRDAPTVNSHLAPAVRIVKRMETFQKAIDSSDPVAINVDWPQEHSMDAHLFGDFRGPSGGATALFSLSGARTGSSTVLLRNPAALELDYLPAGTNALTRWLLDGEVSVTAVGLSAGMSVDSDVFRDAIAAQHVWDNLRHSRHRYWVLVEVAAAVDPPVVIPPGSVFAQMQLNDVQTLAVSSLASFTITSAQSRTVALPVWCLNKELKAPGGQPVALTPFSVRYPATMSETHVWRDRSRILRRDGQSS